MRITLEQARTFLAPFVGSGLASNNPKVVDAINEAIMRLLPKLPAEGTMGRMRFYVNNGTITMPREVNRLISVCVDDIPVNIFSRWYEFLNYGPGGMDANQSSSNDFIDLGDGFCTHSDVHTPRQLLVVAGEEEQDASIRIMGFDENGEEVRTDGVPGESVLIKKNMPHYTVNKFSAITSVRKPTTKGYVYLSAYAPDPLERFDLATYHPDETNPCYRRYRITAICQCKQALTNCALCSFKDTCRAYTNCALTGDTTTPPYTATALVKLRYLPLVYDTDPLLIQNLPAIKMMLQAIRRLDSGEFPVGKAFETSATAALLEQNEDNEPENSQINIAFDMPSPVCNII
jgi:hypothetical protein